MNLKIFDHFQNIAFLVFIDAQTVSFLDIVSLFKLAPEFLGRNLCSV